MVHQEIGVEAEEVLQGRAEAMVMAEEQAVDVLQGHAEAMAMAEVWV